MIANEPTAFELEHGELLCCRFADDDPEEFGIFGTDSLAQQEDKRVRARLLADAVQVSEELMPSLANVFNNVVARLGLEGSAEAYVYSDAACQARCVYIGGEKKAAVLLSSGLVNLLDFEELRFVIGHELGHLIFGHHGYPSPTNAETDHDRLNYLALSRAAEISADRIGFLASDGKESVVRAIVKTSTGLGTEHLRFDVASYLDQLRGFISAGGLEESVFATHPMFPVRLKALLWFEMSEIYSELSRSEKNGTLPLSNLDARIAKDLEAASASTMNRIQDEVIANAAVWAYLQFAVSDNLFSKTEQETLVKAFGAEVSQKAMTFVTDQGPQGVSDKLEASIQKLCCLPKRRRKEFLVSVESVLKEAVSECRSSEQYLRDLSKKIGLQRR